MEEAAPFAISAPWMVAKGPEFLTVHDRTLNEVCRIPLTVPGAEILARLITALPWLIAVANRVFEDLTAAAERKNGMTLRQWVRNHEGAQRRNELYHALSIGLSDTTAGDHPPASYGVTTPTLHVRPRSAKPEKSFREMLE